MLTVISYQALYSLLEHAAGQLKVQSKGVLGNPVYNRKTVVIAAMRKNVIFFLILNCSLLQTDTLFSNYAKQCLAKKQEFCFLGLSHTAVQIHSRARSSL